MAEFKRVEGARNSAPVIIQPLSTHTCTFVLLHGLGSNGDIFGRELLETGISSEGETLATTFPGAKFIFPTAKWRRSSAFNRIKLTQWFDMYNLKDLSQRRELALEGFSESATYIRSIISQELKTLPPEKIILGGLSQGCAMSLLILLTLEFPLCAFIGMSGRLPHREDIDIFLDRGNDDATDDPFSFNGESEPSAQDPAIQAINFIRDLLSLSELSTGSTAESTSLSTPVFFGHGAKDEKVECHLSEEATTTLRGLGMRVTRKVYPDLGHWYKVPDEIDDIIAFLSDKL